MSYPPKSGPMTQTPAEADALRAEVNRMGRLAGLTPEETVAELDEATLVYRSPVAIMRERLTSLRAKANHEREQAALFHDMSTRHGDAARVATAEADDLAALLERLEDEGAGVEG